MLERDVVLMGRDGGSDTIDLPITCLKNIEDTADVKQTPAAEDFLPIVDSADGGQMKKAPLSAILEPISAASAAVQEAKETAEAAQAAAGAAATMAQVDAAIQGAVLDSWEGSY